MLNNIDSYKATGIFIIIERLYNRDVSIAFSTLPASAHPMSTPKDGL